MKIRFGFISNSSSSSFILDLNRVGSQYILKQLRKMKVPLIYGVGRRSGYGTKEQVKEFLDELEEWSDDYYYWLLKYYNELDNNILYIRLSDEYEPINIKIPERLILDERDYH